MYFYQKNEETKRYDVYLIAPSSHPHGKPMKIKTQFIMKTRSQAIQICKRDNRVYGLEGLAPTGKEILNLLVHIEYINAIPESDRSYDVIFKEKE